MAGRTLSRRGQAKAAGGVGIKTARVNPRRFLPNLKRTRIFLGGRMKKVLICTKCLKAGRLPAPLERGLTQPAAVAA